MRKIGINTYQCDDEVKRSNNKFYNMRVISTFLITCFSVSASMAQTQMAIPKHTNAIEVKKVTYEQAVKILLDEGYLLKDKDDKFQLAKTEFRKFGTGIYQAYLSINIRIKDSIAILRAEWYSYSTPIQELEYRNFPTIKMLFNKLKDYAFELRGDMAYSRL